MSILIRRIACISLLFAWPALAHAQDVWTLTDCDFNSRTVGLTALTTDQLTLQAGGATQTLPWDSVLELTHPTSAQTPGGDFVLLLNGGDSINGFPDAVAGDTVTWTQSALGQFDIPEDRVNAILRNGKDIDGLDDPRVTDSVHLANGDLVSGVVQGVTSTTVTIQTAGADTATPITLDKVDAILFADSTPRAVPLGRAFRIKLDDGSALSFPFISLASGQLSAGFSPQSVHPVDLNSVSAIEQVNGPVTWLTALNPQIIYRPFLSENFPPRFDHPVAEPNISIADKYPRFHHGIGVHAYTRLTYAIPDGYSTLRTQYAIDTILDSDSNKADVTIRIFIDGKAVKEIPHVRAGPPADPLLIDLRGAKAISLEVDYGDNLATQGRFVWLDPAFLRDAPTTQPQ